MNAYIARLGATLVDLKFTAAIEVSLNDSLSLSSVVVMSACLRCHFAGI